MQFAKLAIFACLLVAVALAAETEKKDHHRSHNRNKAHHKSRNHKEHKEEHHERKHKEHGEHKKSHERNHGSHMVHASRSHGHGKSERQAEPQPNPDCTCSNWECPIVTPPITDAPITIAPITVAPITVAPITDGPITIAPVTVAPVTVAPVTVAPITDAPITIAPVTVAPVTVAPVTDAPITVAPVTVAPITNAPITDAPITVAPITDAPITIGPNPVTTRPMVDGNWELEIKISGNVSVRLIFNADLKFFGIFNAEKKLAIIFDAQSGLVGIFNIETSGALILNLSANVGVYIEKAGDISGLFGANFNLEVAFKALLEIVKDVKITANGENSFKITAFLQAVVEGKLNADIAVFKRISVGFAVYIALLVNVQKQIAIFGVVSVIIPIFVEITDVSKGLLELFAAISINLAGKFTAAIFTLIRQKIEFDIKVGGVILAGITGAIRGVGSIFVSLDAAIKAYIDNVIVTNVNTGTVVTIDGVVTITTAVVAKGSWLITIVNKDLNIGIFYDKASNVLGILNKKLNVAVVLLSSGNLYAFVNIATGGVLIANYLTGNARVVTALELKAAFAVDILLIGSAFAKAAAVIKVNADGLGNIIFAPKDSFNLGAVVASLALAIGWETSYNLVFIGSAAVKAAVDLHFKAIFVGLRAQLGIFGVLAQGGLALILPITGNIKIVSEGFFKIILGIYGDLKGTFNAELMMTIFVDFNVSIVKYIRGEVKALFNAVLSAIGKFKGFLGGIFAAVSGVVSAIHQAHVNVDISFGFGFGFGGTGSAGGSIGGGAGGEVGGGAGGGGGGGGSGGGGVIIGGGGGAGGTGGVIIGG